MPTVIGLFVAKINGIYRLDVTNARWSARRNVTQEATGAGVVLAKGLTMPTGSFEEVVPRTGKYDWSSATDFSIQLYDYETQKVLLMQAEHCEWGNIDGSGDMAAPRVRRNITWFGTLIPVV